MPSKWPAAALKAQAVAARSYALANLTMKRDRSISTPTRAARSTAASAPSRPTATRRGRRHEGPGRPLPRQGRGHALLLDVGRPHRVGARRRPEWRSRTSSRSQTRTTRSRPYHDWGPVVFDAAKVAKQLKLAPPLADLSVADGPSGRVTSVTRDRRRRAGDGHRPRRSRTQLELRSTWFTPARCSRSRRRRRRSRTAARLSLTGFARGARSASLEAKTAGSDWVARRRADPRRRTESFATIVKPQVATQYRLAGRTCAPGSRRSPSPRGSTAAAIADGRRREPMRPALAGAAVQLQRQSGDGVDDGLLDDSRRGRRRGRSAARSTPGAYRVRCAPGRGVAAGLSAAFTVAVKRRAARRARRAALAVPAVAFGFDNTGAVRRERVVPRPGLGVVVLADAAAARSRQGRRHRLGDRRHDIPISAAASSRRKSFVGGSAYTTSRGTGRSSPARSPPTRRTASAWPAWRSTPG